MKRLWATTVICIAALLGAATVHAELAQRGNLRLSFDGGFSPRTLPRHRAVPVTVSLSGSVKTTNGSRPPQLRRIAVAVNRYGRLSTRGLPRCPAGRLEQTSSQVALARCRGALVGRGRFGAVVDLRSANPFPVQGRMLAFNARVRGRPAILLHIHASRPVRATVVLTFRISRRRHGRFGTVLTARIPPIAADLGYVTDVSLRLHRTYRHRGVRQSFLSASCAAPTGFPGAIFTLAKGSFLFADGKRLTANLTRNCLVR